MEKITKEDVKKIELDLLKCFSEICDLYGFKWYLGGGTLLGAVRHKGMIPWDDDIDVMMPRESYERFLKARNEIERPEYIRIDTYIDGNCFYPFIKLSDNRTILYEKNNRKDFPSSVNIDIFPIDGVPDDIDRFKKLCRKFDILRRLLLTCIYNEEVSGNNKKRRIKVLLNPIFKLIGPYKISKWIDSMAKRYDFYSGKYVACLVWGYGDKELVSRESFEKQMEMEFEGRKYPVPQNYDEYLTNHYGHYMELPPMEQRIDHDFTAFWK